MFKVGSGICFIVLSCFCFAESVGSALSEESKKEAREALYFLLDLDESEKNHKKIQKRAEHQENPIEKLLNMIMKKGEYKEIDNLDKTKGLAEDTKGMGDLEQEKSRYSEMVNLKWKTVMAANKSSYVISLFQEDERLMDWIKRSAEPLYHAIQYGKLDLVRFFVKNSKMINAARESTHFSPLHVAILSLRLGLIQFFLDHPDTNLRQTNIWGENIFHTVFLTGEAQKGKKRTEYTKEKVNKLEILRFLFQPKYFVKVFDLLNSPNHYNETPLDFAERDDLLGGSHGKRIIISLIKRHIELAKQLKEIPKEDLEALRLGNTTIEAIGSLSSIDLSAESMSEELGEQEGASLFLENLSKKEVEALLVQNELSMLDIQTIAQQLPKLEANILLRFNFNLSKEDLKLRLIREFVGEKEALELRGKPSNEIDSLLLEFLPRDILDTLLRRKLFRDEKRSLLSNAKPFKKSRPLSQGFPTGCISSFSPSPVSF